MQSVLTTVRIKVSPKFKIGINLPFAKPRPFGASMELTVSLTAHPGERLSNFHKNEKVF